MWNLNTWKPETKVLVHLQRRIPIYGSSENLMAQRQLKLTIKKYFNGTKIALQLGYCQLRLRGSLFDIFRLATLQGLPARDKRPKIQ